MSLLLRPPVLRVGLRTAARASVSRGLCSSLSLASRGLHTTPPKTEESLSTALNTATLADEAKTEAAIVGKTGRGVEGAHYNDKLTDAAAPLTDVAKGGWTLSNPIYTPEELDTVRVVGRDPVTIGDKIAHGWVKILRRSFDLFSGYTDKDIPAEVLNQRPVPVKELRANGDILGPQQWMMRIILLESIAGVPGMVAGTLRHLRSLRLMRRDGGWIHTLLAEAENERMHLLTFLTIAQPSIFTRALVIVAQGVFYNAFFLTYLFSPKMAHRFVGALEEEAVRTYTHCIEDFENNLLPEWSDRPAPQIAIDYWRMAPDAKLLDVIKAVRADEATHRFVNHSLADLDQKRDFNPFALAEPSAVIRATVPGFTREQSTNFALEQQQKLLGEPEQKPGQKQQEKTQPGEDGEEDGHKKMEV